RALAVPGRPAGRAGGGDARRRAAHPVPAADRAARHLTRPRDPRGPPGSTAPILESWSPTHTECPAHPPPELQDRRATRGWAGWGWVSGDGDADEHTHEVRGQGRGAAQHDLADGGEPAGATREPGGGR